MQAFWREKADGKNVPFLCWQLALIWPYAHYGLLLFFRTTQKWTGTRSVDEGIVAAGTETR